MLDELMTPTAPSPSEKADCPFDRDLLLVEYNFLNETRLKRRNCKGQNFLSIDKNFCAKTL
jgi:hypothetical protein